MSTVPLVAQFRGNRRIRVKWTGSLAAGAFTSTTPYAVTSLDAAGFNPIVMDAVFAIAGDPASLELAVNVDWTSGGQYQVGFTAVPCADLTNFTGNLVATLPLQVQDAPNSEPETSDIDLLLYGRDLAHDGSDFLEDATGDLLTTTGVELWQNALVRRMLSQGLTWDPDYSPQADEFVDAPPFFQKPLGGRIVAQALADNRTKTASLVIVQTPSAPGDFHFQLSVTPVSGPSIALNFSPPTS